MCLSPTRSFLPLVSVLALLAVLSASASADVGPAGWGISDDVHVPHISLDATFDELEPKSFRLNATFTALSDPGYIAQIRARIDEANAAARTAGGMEIAVSFTVPPPTWNGVPLTGQAWLDQVAPFIDRFSAEVEWWSPMNEPGLEGWTFTPAGASMLADFSVRLKRYLEQRHPTDKLLSPDFSDHYDAYVSLKRHTDGTSYVERYVKLFAEAGGEFGSAVAWHAYGAVRRRSFLSTDDLVAALSATAGAGLPIWVTEAGAHVDDDYVGAQSEAEQNAEVKWMTDTVGGLASHDGITRLNYYNMREEPIVGSAGCGPLAGFPWDTGLVRACGAKRPAWFTWCLASRRSDPGCFDDSLGGPSWEPYRLDGLRFGDDAAVMP